MEQAPPPAAPSIWDQRFDELTAFIKANGHSQVTPRNTENIDLRGWIVVQRLYARLGTLDPVHRERLEQLGFDWEPANNKHRQHHLVKRREARAAAAERREARPAAAAVRWETLFQQLVTFKERTGHTRVPISPGEERRLGIWVSNLRSLRRQTTTMDLEEIRRLDGIGFEWKPRVGRRSDYLRDHHLTEPLSPAHA